MLRGDEVGVLLGAHVIARGVDPDGPHAVLARSIVSSRLLGAMAEAAGLPGVETLTGFKWIGRVPRLRYGYEEAIGYCVDPAHVADKDGISAALLIADMVANLRAHGPHAARRPRRPRPRPRRLRHRRLLGAGHRPLAHRRASWPGCGQRRRPRSAASPVVRIDDLAEGAGPGLPPTDGLRYLLADDTRVIVRPIAARSRSSRSTWRRSSGRAGGRRPRPHRGARAEAARRLRARAPRWRS